MKSELICWDSSVLIDWIKGDTAPQDRIRSIKSVVEIMKTSRFGLIVSTLIYVEVLESTMPDEAIEKFQSFMKNREMIEIIAVDIRVAEKARAIRDRTGIKTPDAVHVATAIVSGAELFHTFDDRLLQFSGKHEVESLTITACDIPGMPRSLFD